MKVQFNGSAAVDIDGHDGVEPGAVVEVSDELGARLLAAGQQIDADAVVTPPTDPLWVEAKKSRTSEPAVAGEGA